MKILYLYPHAKEREFREYQAGKQPSDRFYGLIELRDNGWQVDFNDRRYSGRFGRFVRWFEGYGIKLYDLKTIWFLRQYDIVVVKDNFTTIISVLCRLYGIPVIYVDALFGLPHRWLKRIIYRVNFVLCSTVIVYSEAQRLTWLQEFKVDPHKIIFFPYAIDCKFYKLPSSKDTKESSEQSYVLSIGRDLGRDFETLLKALEQLDLRLKLITTPKLFPKGYKNEKFVEQLDNISYQELFKLYANAVVIVLPLKKNINYPSGIRGLLESLVLGKPTIVSRTPVLEEYFKEAEVAFVEPEDVDNLRDKIEVVCGNEEIRKDLSSKAASIVSQRYDISDFATEFTNFILKLQGRKHP